MPRPSALQTRQPLAPFNPPPAPTKPLRPAAGPAGPAPPLCRRGGGRHSPSMSSPSPPRPGPRHPPQGWAAARRAHLRACRKARPRRRSGRALCRTTGRRRCALRRSRPWGEAGKPRSAFSRCRCRGEGERPAGSGCRRPFAPSPAAALTPPSSLLQEESCRPRVPCRASRSSGGRWGRAPRPAPSSPGVRAGPWPVAYALAVCRARVGSNTARPSPGPCGGAGARQSPRWRGLLAAPRVLRRRCRTALCSWGLRARGHAETGKVIVLSESQPGSPGSEFCSSSRERPPWSYPGHRGLARYCPWPRAVLGGGKVYAAGIQWLE